MLLLYLESLGKDNIRGNKMNISDEIISILEDFWPRNKAKGLLAQTILSEEIENGAFGKDAVEKLMPGCWLISPKSSDFFKFRFAFFVHPYVLKSGSLTTDLRTLLKEKYRPFYANSEFLNNAGIGIIYVVVNTTSGTLPFEEIKNRSFENINWTFYRFKNGEFREINSVEFFHKWDGNRGRPSYGGNWDPEVKQKIGKLDKRILLRLLLNELFYLGLLKGVLRKPLNDPYDVDAFMISLSQKHVFPMEIKEKFPGNNGDELFFGIDAGRIMMLLRLALPNDANAIYLVREMDNSGEFKGWKYITLSDIIMTSGWNLQAGGPGMGGQSTQTVRLSYNQFKQFDCTTLTEDSLRTMGELPKEIRDSAGRFRTELLSKFYGE